MHSLIILFTRFGPYHVARIGAAARRFAADGLNVIGMEVASTDADYAWEPVAQPQDFRRETLFPDASYPDLTPAAITRDVQRALDSIAPIAVAVPGWSQPEARAALAWCRRRRVPAILMSESARADAPRVWWREWIKRRRVHAFAAALVGGSRHAAYAAELGLPPERIHSGYDTVDNAWFASGADLARSGAAAARAQHGLPERYFLATARFVPKKNLARLVAAFAEARRQPDIADYHLVLCGDGPLRSAIERQIADLHLCGHVHLAGFASYRDLPAYYGLAQAFVHASTVEQWGLVVNEAMAAGLPVLVSSRCGCTPELVQDGRNGFAFDPANTAAMADALVRFARLSATAQADMGAASRAIIADWSPARFADGLAAAWTAATAKPA